MAIAANNFRSNSQLNIRTHCLVKIHCVVILGRWGVVPQVTEELTVDLCLAIPLSDIKNHITVNQSHRQDIQKLPIFYNIFFYLFYRNIKRLSRRQKARRGIEAIWYKTILKAVNRLGGRENKQKDESSEKTTQGPALNQERHSRVQGPY